MGTSTILLDSQAPQVTASSLTGMLGENNWYVSDVDISVSFADPTPGSGLDRIDVSLNGGAPQPFAPPLTLGDGQHDVLIRAFDVAGNLTELSQTVLVDTVAPEVQTDLDGTLAEGWYVKTALLSATAVDPDPASGLAGLDVSLNGDAWTPYTAALTIGHGQHQAVFRARDVAGNLTVSAPLPFQVDAKGPRIDLPEGWKIWETATFAVRDSESGLGGIEVIISDPQGRWPPVKRAYNPSGGRYEGQISWNRRFADDTLAPVGSYRVTVKASDLAGNFSQKQATLSIPAVGDPVEEGTLIIVQPAVEAEDPPLETVFALPPEEPKAAPAAAETVFGAPSLAVINEAWQANSLATIPPLAEPEGINWGAGALAAAAGMSAYYLSKRREEEEAQRRAVREQVAAKNDALRAKEAQMREQAKIQNYLQGKAMLEAQLAQSDLSDDEKAAIRAQAQAEGMAAGLNLTAAAVAARTAPVPVKRKVKSSILPSNETPDKTSSVWRFLREHDSEGSLVFGPDWNRNGGRVAQFALDNYKLSNLVYQFTGDGNTNCSNFLSHMWWQAGVRFPGSGWNIEKFKERPFDTVVWQQVGPQQGIFSSYHGEFRIVYSNGRGEPGVLRDQPSFNNILENFPQIFQPGSAVFYYNSYYEHKYSWQHAAILVGIDNPSNYFSPSSLNSNSHPAVVEQDGLFDVNDKPRAVRSLDDTGTTTLSQISLVPAQPINPAHYNISPSDLPAASLDGKDCYILRSGGESEFSLYYCPPTLPTVP